MDDIRPVPGTSESESPIQMYSFYVNVREQSVACNLEITNPHQIAGHTG